MPNDELTGKVWELVLELVDYRRHPERSDYRQELNDLADEIRELAGVVENDLDQKADYERDAKKGEL